MKSLEKYDRQNFISRTQEKNLNLTIGICKIRVLKFLIVKTLKNIKFSCFKKIKRDRKVQDTAWNLWKCMIGRNLFQELKKKNLNLMITIFRIRVLKFLIIETFKNMKFSCFKNWKETEKLFKCMINRNLSLDVIRNRNLTIAIFRVLGAYSQYFIFSVTYELVW